MILTKESFVLIIDDNSINRKILEILLTSSMNISHIESWEDSDDFLEKMHSLKQKPDLIFMDVMIHPDDGYEMFRQLRSDSQFDDIKVIAHTAAVMQEQVERLRGLKFDGLISKPVTRELFPELVNRIMAGEPIWYVS